jgi:2-oxoglutarate dehydrogenase E2 component (dihydrolipoamide succinyltransferase)
MMIFCSKTSFYIIFSEIGDHVSRDELVANIETDKITLPVNAPEDGTIVEVYAQPGDTVAVGADFYKLELGGSAAEASTSSEASQNSASAKVAEPLKPNVAEPAKEAPKVTEPIIEKPKASEPVTSEKPKSAKPAPSSIVSEPVPAAYSGTASTGFARSETVTKLTPMRQRIAQRLKESQAVAASLTTFNEVDMSALIQMRALYKDDILKKHGVKFGFMSPFIKAAAATLLETPVINSRLQGDTLIQPNFVDISVAVATPKGLVTPVLRDCQSLSLIGIERALAQLSERARAGQLAMTDLQGGTFTISNGGVFGSLMGTPIINLPQSAILGMHAIRDSPIALNGNVVIRPMMHLALTYDHRIIDGREAVTFLVRLKKLLEDPRRFLMDI